jgi:hypothetical protein
MLAGATFFILAECPPSNVASYRIVVIIGAIAELERSLIIERVRRGMLQTGTASSGAVANGSESNIVKLLRSGIIVKL